MKITTKLQELSSKGPQRRKVQPQKGQQLQQPEEQQPQLHIATLDHVSGEPISLDILLSDVDNYKGGNISRYLYNWPKITIDSVILDIVQNGFKMDFIDKPPTQTKAFSFHLRTIYY